MKPMLEFEGTTLGHYQLQRRLARGGMSEIYLAYDESMQRTVAIKVVHRGDHDYKKRFQREVKALATLTHEHILPILDYGEQGSWSYFVMPYIEGGTLRQRLARGPLSQEEAGMILEQVASALQHAHERGIMHRDIKPANILLHKEKRAYLADFGLAKELGQRSDITQTGELIGTPEYIAPELTQGPGSASSDIYALGIVLYQMLTGQVPFKANTPIAVCWKHVLEPPVPPSLLNSTITPAIEQVILCALEKDPGRRFQNAQALAFAYKQALQARPRLQTLQLAAPHIRYKAHVTTTGFPGQQALILRRAHQRKVHPAIVALAAIVFFVFPLSLGILAYKDSLPAQLPLTLGASVVFAQPHGTLYEGPSHLQPTPITQVTANITHGGQNNNSTPITQTSVNRGHGSQSNNLTLITQTSVNRGYGNQSNNKHGNNGRHNNGQGKGQHGKGQGKGHGKGSANGNKHGHKQGR